MNSWKRFSLSFIHPVIAILIGLLAGAAAMLIVGESVIDTYIELWNGAFGNFYFFTSTLARATPIILVGLGVALAFRAGFFNLGAEGQMVFGAIVAALTALYLPGPGLVKLIGACIAGMASGGLWSLLAGWLDVKFRINLLISTLLLNYIAILFAGYLVSYPFKDTSGSAALAQTAMIDPTAWLPKLFKGMSVSAGFIIAGLAALMLAFVIRSTVFGYKVNMMGYNSFFAVYGGVNRQRLMLISMFASGGLAGLGGTVEVLGTQYRYVEGALTIPGYAWTGLMATLLANANPLGTALASFLLAALQTGAMGVERNTEVPMEIASVIQSILILFVSAKFSYYWFLRRKRKERKVHGTTV